MSKKSRHLDTTSVGPDVDVLANRQKSHRIAYESTLREVFLKQGIQLRDAVSAASRETTVYFGLYQGEEVAIKVFTMASDRLNEVAAAYGGFKVECEKTMVLSRRSRHIVQVLEYGDAALPEDLPAELASFFPLGLVPFMITERAPFGSLDQVMRNYRKHPGFNRLSMLEAISNATEGLKEAHEHQVAHRDIKPQNLLVFGAREGKLADFGVARWRSHINPSQSVMLTPRYCSPEQAFNALTGQREGLVGMAGDIYSWAIMVYEVLTGRHPFEWALVHKDDQLKNQRAILKAIAGNDRQGFLPIGDITIDNLINACTADLRQRIRDIASANKVLKQFVRRQSTG